MSTEDLLAQLIETLDDELEQLALLRFRLVVLGSLVAADQAVWLPMSVRELQATTDQLRLIDLRRAAATSGITEAYFLDPEAHLPQIAAQVDDGWGEMLHDRRRLLLEQVANIRSVADLTISALGRRSTLLQDASSFVSMRRRFHIRAPEACASPDRAGRSVSDFGLSIAASGLNADTAELDTASNNLSNINTPGYAQEVVNLSPEAAAGPLEAGRGVTVASVSELTDAVYESANVAAEGVQGAAERDEPGDDLHRGGLSQNPAATASSAQLSTFWSDLSTLAANPNQAGAQQTVRGRRQRSGPGAQHHLDAALRSLGFPAVEGRAPARQIRGPSPKPTRSCTRWPSSIRGSSPATRPDRTSTP